jgi:hypothetical protein
MRSDAPNFIVLLCLTPDDFTRQWESTATQWVKMPGLLLNMLGYILLEHIWVFFMYYWRTYLYDLIICMYYVFIQEKLLKTSFNWYEWNNLIY